jgi:deferrochelatase/peroxidase EfeB
MSTLTARFRFIATEANIETQKERNNYEFSDSHQKKSTPATSHRTGVDHRRVCPCAGDRNAVVRYD